MIKCENVSKVFRVPKNRKKDSNGKRELRAVDAVGFLCRPGEVTTLLGPNGAGKTTLLRMIATMLSPSEGTIAVCGFDTQRDPEKVRGSLGFLTGNTGLYDRLTAEEMVRYFADLQHMPRSRFRERRDILFPLLGIDEFAGRRVGQLSTGMKQRVSIARTIIHDPDVVIFDEPTSGLDIISARSIIQLIRRCREENKTVLFSTHRMDEVSLLSDHLLVIHKGRVVLNESFRAFKEQVGDEKSLEEAFMDLVEES